MSSGDSDRELGRLKQVFPVRLELAMERRGIKKLQLAAMAEVIPSTVSSWCRGHQLPRAHQLCVLAKVLGVPLDYLLDAGDSGLSHNLEAEEVEILEYVGLENSRDHFPRLSEIEDLFGSMTREAVQKLQRLRYLKPETFVLTTSGRKRVSDANS